AGIRELVRSRGLGVVYKRQRHANPTEIRIILDGSDKYELTIENDLNNVDTPVIGESDLKTLRARAKVINSEISASSNAGFFSLHITQK
ncbi:MAG: hypothetical protein K2L57_02735, partial [Muribaculaceae bacterium]|nr:hypothetical protein [Muribaculaceae bacterium]